MPLYPIIKDIAEQVYTSGQGIWTGTTAPSGTETSYYKWSQSGKNVTLWFFFNYATAGAAVSQVQFPLPTDVPTPDPITGFNAATVMQYFGVGGIGTTPMTNEISTSRAGIIKNAANTACNLYMQMTSGAYKFGHIEVTYRAI